MDTDESSRNKRKAAPSSVPEGEGCQNKRRVSLETSDDDMMTVVVGDQEFQASSLLLRYSCPYFKAAFRTGMKEAQTMRFEFPEMCPIGWKLLMGFLEPFDDIPNLDLNRSVKLVLPWFDFLGVTKGLQKCDKHYLNLTKAGCPWKVALANLETVLKYDLPRARAEYIRLIKKKIGDGNWYGLPDEHFSCLWDLLENEPNVRDELWEQLTFFLPDNTKAQELCETEREFMMSTKVLRSLCHANREKQKWKIEFDELTSMSNSNQPLFLFNRSCDKIK